jgi:hypothetical protein
VKRRLPDTAAKIRAGVLAAVAIAVAVGAFAAAAPAFAAATSTTVPRSQALAAFRSCMSAHGVKLTLNPRPPASAEGGAGSVAGAGSPTGDAFPRGTGTGSFVPRNLPKGVTVKKYEAARKACASKLPAGGFGFGGRNSQQFQAYLSCLSDHGVTVPKTGGLRGLNRNDPTFQAANQICGVLLPQRPGGGPGGAPTTTTPTQA